jgi:hypothetical protein
MPGLRSDVNPLAGDAVVACATAVEGTSVPGAGGRAAADSVGGYEAGPESRAPEVADTPASENGRMPSACFHRVDGCLIEPGLKRMRPGRRLLSSEPVVRVRDCSTRAVPPTGRGARGPWPGSCCAHGFVGLLDAA